MPNQQRRKSYARIPDVLPLPDLIEVQLESYRWFQDEGLRELFDEVSPIESFNGNLELHFPGFNEEINEKLGLEYRFEEPKYTQRECLERDITFAIPLYVRVALWNKESDEWTTQDVFMGDFPLMTENGTFIINGAERVVVSQLIRSPGVYFSVQEDRITGRELCMAKLIPNRGAWLEFETAKRDILSVKVDRKRKLPVTILLRAVGYGTDEELQNLFQLSDIMPDHPYIQSTIERDPTKTTDEALLEFYKKLRPGDPPTLDNAKGFLESLLFAPRRYDLGRVGRHKLNKRLEIEIPLERRTLTQEDLVKVVERMIQINNGIEGPDDIDHLGNRRVKTMGELIQNQLRIGLLRMERVVRERMSIREPEQMTPISLINVRPVVAATREFFGGSQLSQFMQQTNPLDELTHKRRLSALGPGGLRRERAGFDVRDVHHSHYGRICPIETPEGPNIGLIGSLGTYARINEYGFIETPYRKVIHVVPNRKQRLVNKTIRERIVDPDSGEVIAEANKPVDEETAERLEGLFASLPEIPIRPMATDQITFLSADEEDRYTIAQANAELDQQGQFVRDRVSVRRMQEFLEESVNKVDYMDVSPKQIVGVTAALIPFLEHDDANRALMGSNMQRQSVPLVKPEAPLVGTGIEAQVAIDSGQIVVAEEPGEVVNVTGDYVVVQGEIGRRTYKLRRFQRSNQSTCLDQRPIVSKGQRVQAGDVLADSSSTEEGELALGQNVLVAFMSWEGGNYEDAVLISEQVVRDDKFTSIHIEKHEVEARDTKLGPEEITRDIPNVGEDALKDLDETGIIRVGAEVGPGNILVGKITPKGETELTPEEKLLRAIFGEKAREVKDSSLRLPHGEHGIVVDVKEFSREEHRDMPAGVERTVRVMVAQRRKVTEGDKMAGRHGNKGVISQVVPVEDMPFLPDGTSVQLILNPLGVPARMNIGQILETHLGWAADQLGFKTTSPVFDGADELEIEAELARAWLMGRAWGVVNERAWAWANEAEIELEGITEQEVISFYLLQWLAGSDYSEEMLVRDRNYARQIVLQEWLRENGYDLDKLISFSFEPIPVEERVRRRERARIVCLKEWIKYLHEEMEKLEVPWPQDLNPDPETDGEIQMVALRLSQRTGKPMPVTGKMILYDGKTGEPFDQPVTVGVISMMKLAHLVEDKVHARSTGPYSLVTQQPLGGKAQFGGQRFGEMEVWALEAYGAAHTLQEMITVKSDDVQGRTKTYEAIVKGEQIVEPGIPEGFRVLVKELQSLGLSVEVLGEEEEALIFGKGEEQEKLPELGMGLDFLNL
ncbi:MAG TPA: DNA-directed RNA polymerase subunit beta [Anaerolineae bacterium]|nr:DNA-directed RNA polymerase subunit beta [Anaerolineae bacterium]